MVTVQFERLFCAERNYSACIMQYIGTWLYLAEWFYSSDTTETWNSIQSFQQLALLCSQLYVHKTYVVSQQSKRFVLPASSFFTSNLSFSIILLSHLHYVGEDDTVCCHNHYFFFFFVWNNLYHWSALTLGSVGSGKILFCEIEKFMART